MKDGSILLRGLYTFSLGYLPQSIHDMGYIYTIRASGGTGFTGGANPDCVATQDLLFQAQMKEEHEFMRYNIHSKGYRTAIGAFFALIACGNLLPAQLLHPVTP